MTHTDFNSLVNNARERQDKLLEQKGADYTRRSADRLANFKETARVLNLTPLQVWAVFATKHWDATMTYISSGRTESEHITGRFDDLHNYLYLLEALVNEQEKEKLGEHTSG